MDTCSAKGCSNRPADGFTLHEFPKESKMQTKWIDSLSCEGWTYCPDYKICEVHFEASMWEKAQVGKRKLKKNAIPTLFPFKSKPNTAMEETVVNIVFEDCEIMASSASITKSSNEDTIIEFSDVLDPLDSSVTNTSSEDTFVAFADLPDPLDISSKRRKMEVNLADTANICNQEAALRTYRQHMSQFGQNQLTKNAQNGTTVTNALKLKFACGQTGYEELLRQKMQLPSVLDLQKHIRGLSFQPGILSQYFDCFSLKASCFPSEHHKDCTIHFDEIPLTPARVFDPVKSKYCGTVTNALAVTLRGIRSSWKQTVAYYFTGSTSTQGEYCNILSQVFSKTEEVGLKVISITCSVEEPPLQKSKNATGTLFSKIRNFKPPTGKLYVFADVRGLFKNIKAMFVSNKIIIIPGALKQQYDLPTHIADYNHIAELVVAQKALNFKLIPTLTQMGLISEDALNESKILGSVISYDISKGLKVLADTWQRPEFKTTAWLIDTMEKWFAIMTSPLSKEVPEVYKETVDFLKDFIKLFSHVQTGDLWQQCRAVVVSTRSLLQMQDVFLNEKNCRVLVTSRFVEGYSHKLRASDAPPTVAQFISNLRLLCRNQFMEDISKSDLAETIKILNL